MCFTFNLEKQSFTLSSSRHSEIVSLSKIKRYNVNDIRQRREEESNSLPTRTHFFE